MQHLNIVLLYLAGLLHDVLIGVGNGVRKELLPFAVVENIVVQQLQLPSQVGDEVGLFVDGKVLVALLGEHLNKLFLQRRLTLIAVRALLRRLVGGDDGIFSSRGDYVICAHRLPPFLSIVYLYHANRLLHPAIKALSKNQSLYVYGAFVHVHPNAD